MLSICGNSSVKSWRTKKRSPKNNKNKPFINKYKRDGKNFPSQNDDSKKFEKNCNNCSLCFVC